MAEPGAMSKTSRAISAWRKIRSTVVKSRKLSAVGVGKFWELKLVEVDEWVGSGRAGAAGTRALVAAAA